jgi:prepilin-type N-terminal cleavage/methylation domain-containing protein
MMKPKRRSRGFNLIELMAVMAVSIIGFLAVLYLQQGVIRGSASSWNMIQATHLARHLLESIRLEGSQWYNDTGTGLGGVGQERFLYLKHVGTAIAGSTSGWRNFDFYPAGTPFQMVDQLGRQGPYDAGALQEVRPDRNPRFCARYRLTWLIPNQLIRAEVRVLWPRDDARAGRYDQCEAVMDTRPADAFAITIPTTVMKNVFVAP